MLKVLRTALVIGMVVLTGCPGCDSAEECLHACGPRGVLKHDNSGNCECNPCRLDEPLPAK